MHSSRDEDTVNNSEEPLGSEDEPIEVPSDEGRKYVPVSESEPENVKIPRHAPLDVDVRGPDPVIRQCSEEGKRDSEVGVVRNGNSSESMWWSAEVPVDLKVSVGSSRVSEITSSEVGDETAKRSFDVSVGSRLLYSSDEESTNENCISES